MALQLCKFLLDCCFCVKWCVGCTLIWRWWGKNSLAMWSESCSCYAAANSKNILNSNTTKTNRTIFRHGSFYVKKKEAMLTTSKTDTEMLLLYSTCVRNTFSLLDPSGLPVRSVQGLLIGLVLDFDRGRRLAAFQGACKKRSGASRQK